MDNKYMNMQPTDGHNMKHFFDGAAALTAFAAFLHYLPAITSVLSFVWLSIQLGGWLIRTAWPWIKEKFQHLSN